MQDENGDAVGTDLRVLVREIECLLSKISADRTVGFLRAKKESCSTL